MFDAVKCLRRQLRPRRATPAKDRGPQTRTERVSSARATSRRAQPAVAAKCRSRHPVYLDSVRAERTKCKTTRKNGFAHALCGWVKARARCARHERRRFFPCDASGEIATATPAALHRWDDLETR